LSIASSSRKVFTQKEWQYNPPFGNKSKIVKASKSRNQTNYEKMSTKA